MLRALLEYIRVIFILLIFGSVFYTGMTWGYSQTGAAALIGRSLVLLASFIFIFIIYRNKLQSNGFYRGKRTGLSQKTTVRLIIIAGLLAVLATLFN
jgi:hypothetical protein